MNPNRRLRWYRDLSKLGALKLRFQNCGFDIDVENIVEGKAGQHLWEILFGTNEVSGKAETSPSKGQVEWGSVADRINNNNYNCNDYDDDVTDASAVNVDGQAPKKALT